jgi:hypothetical protein
MMENKKLTWLVMGVIGKRGEREEQKSYCARWWEGGCMALLGVKSGHQKTKSSDTSCKEEFYQKLKCTKVTTLLRIFFVS